MKAVIYGRVSTDRQSELSIEAQIDYCEGYCLNNGWDVVNYYTDYGLSGTSAERRPALMQLLADARNNDFDVVVAHKVDRAFRNTRDYENIKYELEKCGVIMAFAETGVNDGVQGDFVNGLMALVAAQYSRNLSREVRKTIRKNVESGHFLGGFAPIGFKIENKKYVVDKEVAPLIVFMYEAYASGQYSMSSLADKLNSLGYRTNRGNNFSSGAVRDILRNEKYKGVYVHNQNTYNNVGHRRGKKKQAKKDVVRVNGVVPRIVSDDLWEKVQNKMKTNKNQKGGQAIAKRFYLLSGLITCGECGAKYHGQPSRNNKGYETLYYACGGRKRKNGCHNMPVNASWIEGEALKCIARMCDKLDLERLTKEVNLVIRDLLLEQKEEIRRQKEKLAVLKREETNLINAIAQMGINPAIEETLREKQVEIKDINLKIERIDPKLIPIFDIKTVSEMFRLTIQDIKCGTNKEKKRAINSVVEEILVYEEEIIIKIKAGLDETGFERSDKVGGNVVAEGGFEPPTSGL